MKYFRQISIGAILAVAGSQNMPAADGIDISHLGTNNTLVRVTDGNSRYVLFPVEESVDDATVNLLLDGKQEKTVRIRLARNRVDYYVPFDISAYKDSKIIFDVVTTQGRASVREASDDACWKNIRLSDTFDTSNVEKYRPAFHHTPLYGWMNDPNGMFYKDGVWHLYYQYNPYGSKWQNMSWGHSTSTDFVNWEHHPVAIEPNSLGQVFSGSCVVDSDNTAGFGKDAVVALYTSAGINQMQSLAYSTDNGETFTIYPGNPIITLESEARDPNMFWNRETNEWNLLLAHALDHEMLIFTSPDLKEWTLQSAFGKGLGAQDGVWECPDLMQLPVDGSDEQKWVLICNLNPGGPFGGSATQYFVGDFDGKKFTADTDSEGNVPTKWMDYGKDHYATVSWSGAPDGRNVVIGWMSNWQYAAEVPTRQYRSANTLPRDISLFKGADGQYYLKTVPSPELLALRNHRTVSAKGKSFGKSPVKFALPEANDGICEINMSLNARKADKVTITLANRQGEKVDMTFDPAVSTFSFDRTQSGLTDFSHDFPAVVTAPTLRNSTSQSLRIFVDRSSIEVFDGEGNFVLTNLVFPGSPYTTLSLAADGGKASLNSLEIYSIKTSNK
ncbi:MAG: DUF4980 domain-containing protein [Muribaculaceae bacterium]|nr:DUF4980 domain-containing protein [Muribaculaceae bacterium]